MNQKASRLTRGRQFATLALCDRHLEARKVLGWSAQKMRGMTAYGCADCARTEPTVLERVIAASDKPAEPATPPAFRDLLLSIARSAHDSTKTSGARPALPDADGAAGLTGSVAAHEPAGTPDGPAASPERAA